MNLKSILIGSAAAILAVSGARAADAVVAEPEAVEYVRVCDAYGEGFFYIPGTETCLKIGGWVRYEIFADSDGSGWEKQARGRLEFTTQNESELGTVTGWIRIENIFNSEDGPDLAHQYSLGVGGLEMGFQDSQWNRFSDYGGLVEGEVGGYYYGYQERHYISYTFSGEDFSAIVSLDHDNDLNYVPDVMAGVKGTFGSVTASASVGYDESDRSFAFKGTLDASVGDLALRFVALTSNSKTGSNAYYNGAVSGDWGFIVGAAAPVGEKINLAADFTYQTQGFWDITGNVNYQIAPGLKTLLEVSHNSDKFTAGMLRFERSF